MKLLETDKESLLGSERASTGRPLWIQVHGAKVNSEITIYAGIAATNDTNDPSQGVFKFTPIHRFSGNEMFVINLPAFTRVKAELNKNEPGNLVTIYYDYA